MNVADEENGIRFWRRPVDSTVVEEDWVIPSKPPSYISPNGNRANDSSVHHASVEGRLQYSEIVRELNAYYSRQNRLNNGISRLVFAQRQEDDEEEEEDSSSCTKYSYACQSCVFIQFKGIFMLFWLLTWLILGIVSVALSGLPRGAQALWVPLFVYIVLVIIVHVRKRKETERIEMLEEQFELERSQMMQHALLDQTKFSLPNDHYFEIQTNASGHTHPVVTLLPPPPTYA